MSLRLQALTVSPPEAPPLLPPLSLEVAPGTVTTLVGASGVGKSMLLDAIGGHLAYGFVMTGTVWLDGREVTHLPPEARRIGILFQDALLFPHLSVGDNLAFGLAHRVQGRTARRTAIERALDQADLSGFHDRDPATLSGGQRARAALMRTLLAEPRALLLDEPFSKLDAQLRREIRAFTFDHVRRCDIPVLMVTHDPGDAEAAAGPVVALQREVNSPPSCRQHDRSGQWPARTLPPRPEPSS